MEKPEDIPQDVWDRAAKCVPDYVKRTIVEAIARAILSAVEEERERCRGVANERAAQLYASAQLPGFEDEKSLWAAQTVEALMIEQRIQDGHIPKDAMRIDGFHKPETLRNRKGA